MAKFRSIPTAACTTAPVLDGTARPSRALTCPRLKRRRKGPSRTTEKLALRKSGSPENLTPVAEWTSGLPGHRFARRQRLPKARFDGLTSLLHIGISARIRYRNRNQLQSGAAAIVYRRGTITLSAGMTDLDRPEEPEDPKELRSAAVDALKDAARQSDPAGVQSVDTPCPRSDRASPRYRFRRARDAKLHREMTRRTRGRRAK
jgi:hypothetical protein